MRYCVSYIHGEYDLFIRLPEKIGFSYDDAMCVCGDVLGGNVYERDIMENNYAP